MSLIKAYMVKNKAMVETNYETLKQEFKEALEILYFTPVDERTKLKGFKVLVTLYTLFGVKYLMEVSDNLNETQHNRDTMSFMNSFLVEICYDLKLKYYVKDMSYSIVDKSIKEALDIILNNEDYTIQQINTEIYKAIDKIIDEIMDSFVEIVEAEEFV